MSEEFPSQDPLEAARIIATDEYHQQKAAEDAEKAAQDDRLGEWLDGSQDNAADVAAYLESRPYKDANNRLRDRNSEFTGPDSRREQIAREEGFKTAGEYAYDDMSVPELAYKLAQAEHVEDRTVQESVKSVLDERLNELDASYTEVRDIDTKVTELKNRELERLHGENGRTERFARARRIGRAVLKNLAVFSREGGAKRNVAPPPEGYEHPLDKFDRLYTFPAKAKVNQKAAEMGESIKSVAGRAAERSAFIRRVGHLGQTAINHAAGLPARWDQFVISTTPAPRQTAAEAPTAETEVLPIEDETDEAPTDETEILPTEDENVEPEHETQVREEAHRHIGWAALRRNAGFLRDEILQRQEENSKEAKTKK